MPEARSAAQSSSTTPFDASERAIWAGTAQAYDRTFARLCAELAPALLDAAGLDPSDVRQDSDPGDAPDAARPHGSRASHGPTMARRPLRVLDVGTGSGTVAALAAARGARVVATDADPAMVALAALRAPGASCVTAALPDLPFDDDTFDVAVAGFVLNHVGRPREALAALRRVVRPGGRVAVTIWAAPPAAGQTLVGRALAAAGVERPAYFPSLPPGDDFVRTPDGLAGLVRGAGLDDVVSERVEWVHRATPDVWWDGPASGVATIGRVLAAQPEEVRSRARACFDALALEVTARDGLLDLPHAALLASGTV